MKKLVIFDCDGTLVDSEIIAAQVFPKVWSSMGLQMTEDYFICNFVGVGSDAEIIKTTLKKLPPNAMEIADQKFDEVLKTTVQPVQGIPELLGGLDREVCVASNSSLGYLNDILKVTGLAQYFGQRVYSARTKGKSKPFPDLFLHAASELGVQPHQCIVVEDSVAGVQAAKNAEMKVIGFMGGAHFNDVVKNRLFSAGADYYCQNALELEELLLRF